jgi:hypothetical protein
MTPAWLRDLGGEDLYQVLGVPRDSSEEEIKRAYRRRIRELHPDRPTGDVAQARLVNLARDILLNSKRRVEYDLHTSRPPGPLRSAPQWNAEDVVAEGEPPSNSAWATEDVLVGAAPPPPDLPPQPDPNTSAYPQQPQYWQPPIPPYVAYPAYRPVAPGPSLGLPVAALVCSLSCVPLGLILGMLGLRQHRHAFGPGKGLSIAAIAVSGGFLLLGLVYCSGWWLLASAQT